MNMLLFMIIKIISVGNGLMNLCNSYELQISNLKITSLHRMLDYSDIRVN